jgi:outer membrane lipopolysaccharide assembly protein LptE/RlpB
MEQQQGAEMRITVVMTATGTVVNPDGTTKEIQLRAERTLTDDERALIAQNQGD